MSEPLPESISKKEFDELRQAVTDLAEAQKELAKAKTEPERKEAREDVKESKADLDALAKELGISRSALDKAAAEARRSEEKERLRPILLEILDEELPEEDDGKTEKTEDAKKTPKKDRVETSANGDEPVKEKEPPKDSEPVVEHWTDRSFAELITGGKK